MSRNIIQLAAFIILRDDSAAMSRNMIQLAAFIILWHESSRSSCFSEMVARTGSSRKQTHYSGEHSTAVGALLARSKYDHAAGDMRAAMPSGDPPDSMCFFVGMFATPMTRPSQLTACNLNCESTL